MATKGDMMSGYVAADQLVVGDRVSFMRKHKVYGGTEWVRETGTVTRIGAKTVEVSGGLVTRRLPRNRFYELAVEKVS